MFKKNNYVALFTLVILGSCISLGASYKNLPRGYRDFPPYDKPMQEIDRDEMIGEYETDETKDISERVDDENLRIRQETPEKILY